MSNIRLTIYFDLIMKAKLKEPGVLPSYCRPWVSNDNANNDHLF